VESLRGRLLVASPTLVDPNFARTVILMLEHTDEGAVGVVLNRPSEVLVGAALPEWDTFAVRPSVFFVGGPVGADTAICIGRSGGTDEVAVIDLERDPDDLAPDEVRLFAGYAGWGPGQLEDELGESSWFVVDAHPEDALSDDPDGLWARVLRRQRGRIRIFAVHPPSLADN
jgi:putative transcriptional regulator